MENLTPEEIDLKFLDYTLGRYNYREDEGFYNKLYCAENHILPTMELGMALGYDFVTQLEMVAIHLQDILNERDNQILKMNQSNKE